MKRDDKGEKVRDNTSYQFFSGSGLSQDPTHLPAHQQVTVYVCGVPSIDAYIQSLSSHGLLLP